MTATLEDKRHREKFAKFYEPGLLDPAEAFLVLKPLTSQFCESNKRDSVLESRPTNVAAQQYSAASTPNYPSSAAT